MQYFLRLYHANWFYFLVLAVLFTVIFRLNFTKKILYRYSLGQYFEKKGFFSKHIYKKIFFCLRLISIIILAVLIMRPQLVDSRSSVSVEGIDIMLVLDASGSMNINDFEGNTRFDVAKQEALRFIQKRDNDPIGLIIFGADAVSRCPITLDKSILKSVIEETDIGIVNPAETVLSIATLMAENRLKDSKSKSKVIILLTDGEPTRSDIPLEIVIETAKKLGIKIYTIGIGSEEQQYVFDPFYGQVQMPKVNAELLGRIAAETGGKFFMAKSQAQMRDVYNEIDKLEKTEYKTNIYNKYFDIFMPFLWLVFIILFFEIFLSLFVWFGI